MGCDGGTIPKRCELVREKKKPEKVDKEIELNAKWFHCAISQEELREPIVSCELGNLYRKEAVLEYLLDKSNATTDVARHIRSLKDVKELVLTKKNLKTKVGTRHAADAYLDFQASDYICAIAGLEMNGRYRFCFSWKCGCVFSERGLKEVPSSICHNCGTSFDEEDIIVINGKEEDVNKLREKMLDKRQKAKEEKKAKKSKRSATENSESVPKDAKKPRVSALESGTKACTSTSVAQPKTKDVKSRSSSSTEANTKSSSTKSSSTKSSSTKSSSSKPSSTKPSSSKPSSSKPSSSKPSSSKLASDPSLTYTKYKSVAENPDASKVFKSLFSSGHKDKPKRLQSNWVTYHSYHC